MLCNLFFGISLSIKFNYLEYFDERQLSGTFYLSEEDIN